MNRVIISGGGTGGHIFPAISIAKTLRQRYPEVEILFIGAEGRMEMSRVPEAGFEIKGLPVRGLQRQKFWRNIGVLWDFIRSFLMARHIIQEFSPEVVIGVGGYASAPTLRAAQWLGIKTLIQEQNSYAGVTNKLLGREANTVCVAYPDMQRFFPKARIVQTGNPVRPEIERIATSTADENSALRAEALRYFGLPIEAQHVVLVIGGSLGARTINDSVALKLAEWSTSGTALIWQTGKAFYCEAQRLLSGYSAPIYCSPFIDRMDLAYAISDLVVSRAGASSISELCLLGKPCILIPSPNVAEDHQTHNALALSSRGAAICIPDAAAEQRLSHDAIALLRDTQALERLGAEAKRLAYPDAAERIVDEIEALVR